MHIIPVLLLFLASAVVSAQSKQSSGITVAISDNVIIIDSNSRSGNIDLVNGGSDPVAFTVYPMNEPMGIEKDAESILRWAPKSALAPPHRSVPFRVIARPTPDLTPGEYALQFGVRAEVQREAAPINVSEADENSEQAISAIVPVVPVLPVTVYVRHQIETPRVDAEPLILTPEHPAELGYFNVVKRNPSISFIGQVQVEEVNTGKILSAGRLHLAQKGEKARVGVMREAVATTPDANYCLKIWDHFPAQSEPYIILCSE